MAAKASPRERLIELSALGEDGVAVVETSHGKLAVGVAGGEPFAVSNRCRHLGASLGEGHVTEEGLLECPWHHACYDVRSGTMERGPGGVFRLAAPLVKGATNTAAKLKTFPVVEQDGVLYLAG